MSIKTFFEKVGDDLKAIFVNTTWEAKAVSTIGYIAPFVSGILTLADPALAPLIAPAVATAESGLNELVTLIKGAKVVTGTPAAQQAQTIINDVNTNLSGILQLAEVKNSAKVADITAAVNMITGETTAMLQGLTGATA